VSYAAGDDWHAEIPFCQERILRHHFLSPFFSQFRFAKSGIGENLRWRESTEMGSDAGKIHRPTAFQSCAYGGVELVGAFLSLGALG